MSLALQLNESDALIIKNFVTRRRLDISEFVRQTVLEKIADEDAKEARNNAYLAKLRRADEQIRNGQVIVKTMDELEAMAE